MRKNKITFMILVLILMLFTVNVKANGPVEYHITTNSQHASGYNFNETIELNKNDLINVYVVLDNWDGNWINGGSPTEPTGFGTFNFLGGDFNLYYSDELEFVSCENENDEITHNNDNIYSSDFKGYNAFSTDIDGDIYLEAGINLLLKITFKVKKNVSNGIYNIILPSGNKDLYLYDETDGKKELRNFNGGNTISIEIGDNINETTLIPSSDIENNTYVIGNYMFSRDTDTPHGGVLTTNYIMLASKSVDSNSANSMIIYYKNARGSWINAITNEPIDAPEMFSINYKDMSEIYSFSLPTPIIVPKSEIESDEPHQSYDDEKKYYTFFYGVENNDSYRSILEKTELYVEIYEKDNDDLSVVGTGKLTDKIEIHGEPGTKKTFVGRIYYLDYSNNKIYSKYSNELYFDRTKYEAPYINIISNLYDAENNYYVYKLSIHDFPYELSEFELYSKVNDTYQAILDANSSDGYYYINVNPGEKIILLTRGYILNSKNEKIYSDYSDEVCIDTSA